VIRMEQKAKEAKTVDKKAKTIKKTKPKQ
jgi:hypothetical protein